MIPFFSGGKYLLEGFFESGIGPYSVALALYTNPSYGFHTVRGGVDPGEIGFRPWFVGVDGV